MYKLKIKITVFSVIIVLGLILAITGGIITLILASAVTASDITEVFV